MIKHCSIARIGVLILACALLFASDASARKVRHHRKAPAGPVAEAKEPFSFYPENIEGGVPGNLPFNNQIRKMKDPLNANGAGR